MIQPRQNCGFDQSSGSGGGDKRSDVGYIWKAEPIKFRSEMWENEESRMIQEIDELFPASPHRSNLTSLFLLITYWNDLFIDLLPYSTLSSSRAQPGSHWWMMKCYYSWQWEGKEELQGNMHCRKVRMAVKESISWGARQAWIWIMAPSLEVLEFGASYINPFQS